MDKYLRLDDNEKNDNEKERFTAEFKREANKEIRAMAVTWEEERIRSIRVIDRLHAILERMPRARSVAELDLA